MNTFIKKNITNIIVIFLFLSPFIDLLTGITLHSLHKSITIGIILRMLFMISICYISLFIYKKKKLLLPYIIIGLYFIFYLLGIVFYKEGLLFTELQGLLKVFYFPIIFISLYSLRNEIRISKMSLLVILFLYLILIFVPTSLGIGYKTYEVTKVGTLGFFNSANEISGIISILTPIMFIILYQSKNIIPKIALFLMYLIVILTMGTKTPLLTLLLTIMVSLVYFTSNLLKKRKYKTVGLLFGTIMVGIICLILIIPKTNFYKNIKTHLDFLKLDNIAEVFSDEKYIDHFIFSSRLKFLNDKAYLYKEASTYEKIFGIGYTYEGKTFKMIEMDYFDIYFSHGIIGFLVFFILSLYVLYKLLETKKEHSYENIMVFTSVLFIGLLSFFTGHIITTPSVSLISVIILLELAKRNKKDLIFSAVSMEIGGIEKALLNLVNRIDKNKYNVTIILERKEGELLNDIDTSVIVKELKVSNNKNIILRKIINSYRKLVYKIVNYHNYDFSCCYATYSYSSSKIALMSSMNSSLYVHSDYQYIYNEKEYKEFFDSRNIYDYKHIIFVSNESRESFEKVYNNLSDKLLVFNNFINVKEILKRSEESINITKEKNKKLFVFVGRLDDSSKKLKRAFQIVKDIKNIDLWVIGDGKDRPMYEEYVKKEKLTNRIRFLGMKENPYPYMKQADYIILTSEYEGFPVIYLESLVLNKQLLTTINTSDDQINIKDYASIISKNEKIIEDVKKVLKENHGVKKIDIEKIQKARMNELEKVFNEVI